MQLRDPQLDGAHPRLPVAIPVAIALHQAVRAAFAMRGAGHLANFQLHQALAAQPIIARRKVVSEPFPASRGG